MRRSGKVVRQAGILKGLLRPFVSVSDHSGPSDEPLAKDPSRLKPLGSFERLGVVEIVVHRVQPCSMTGTVMS
jgi:hypothetical protein